MEDYSIYTNLHSFHVLKVSLGIPALDVTLSVVVAVGSFLIM